MEEEAEKDKVERDEFAKRVREREKKSTRRIVSKSEAKAAAEATKRLKLAETTSADDKAELMEKLRYESRKDYLSKRKEDKTYELEAIVRDDEVLFGNELKLIFFNY